MSHPLGTMYDVGNQDGAQAFIGLDVVTAFVLLHGRIEWRSGWTEAAHSAPGVFTTRADAEAAAFNAYEQGSVFRIRQVPALRVRAYNATYLVSDYLQSMPFDGIDIRALKHHIALGTPLDVVLHALQPNGITWKSLPVPDGVVATRLGTGVGTTLAIGQRLGEWSSMVIGAPFDLLWIREETACDRRRVRAIEQAFQRVNAEDAAVDSDALFARRPFEGDALALEIARGLHELEEFSRRVWQLNSGNDTP